MSHVQAAVFCVMTPFGLYYVLMNTGRKMKDEKNTKVQWINLHHNKSFVNRMRLPLLCEKSGAIVLVLVGLTAGRQASSPQAARQNTRFEYFKDCIVRIFKEYYRVLL